MKNEPFLFWEHGTLLQPQHFQSLTSQTLSALQFGRMLATPYPWGLTRLAIDEDSLKAGLVVVREFEGVFGDGTHASLGENAVLAQRSCEQAWTNPEEPLMVHVGLYGMRPDAANVTLLDSLGGTNLAAADTRFVATHAPETRPECLAGGEEADVRFMFLNLKIVFLGEEEGRRMGLLPVARLVHDAFETRLDKSFVPPCLDIQAFALLSDTLASARNSIAGRLRQLEEFKLSARETGGRVGRALISAQSLALHSMLQVLSRQMPRLEHLCETGHVHPWIVYSALRELIGELSLFSPDINVLGVRRGEQTGLPPYTHEDPGTCFAAAGRLVTELVELLAAGPAHIFTLDRDRDLWTCLLPEHARSGYDFWLQIRTENAGYLAAIRQSGLRFASEDALPTLLARSLEGVPLLFEDAPQGLPQRDDTVYLLLDSGNAAWAQIHRTGKAALFLPDAPADCQAQLALMTPLLGRGQTS